MGKSAKSDYILNTTNSLIFSPFFLVLPLFPLSSLSASITMSRSSGGGVNEATRLLTSGVAPGSPNTNANFKFSAASQADWAAKRLVWVPSEKHGFEVSGM